jgi:hypothetical protein
LVADASSPDSCAAERLRAILTASGDTNNQTPTDGFEGEQGMLKEGMDKAQIVAVLQGYAYDISRIFALIPQGGGAAKQAQARLSDLKHAVHNDYKQRYAIARTTQLAPLEQKNLARAINDVFFSLQGLGVNSNPSTEWRNALFSADMDIQRCLSQLQTPEAQTAHFESTDWF